MARALRGIKTGRLTWAVMKRTDLMVRASITGPTVTTTRAPFQTDSDMVKGTSGRERTLLNTKGSTAMTKNAGMDRLVTKMA